MLVDLPQEILDSIALHLDLPSARSLALTCQATRKAAEAIIWSDIACTWDYEENYPYIDGPDFPAVQIVASRYERCAHAFKSYPPRRQAVRYAKLGINRYLDDMPRRLLEDVGPSLHRLDIETTHENLQEDSKHRLSCLEALYRGMRKLARMEGVVKASTHIGLRRLGENLIKFLNSIPNVEQLSLVICQEPEAEEDVDELDSENFVWSAKPTRLTHLEVDVDLTHGEHLEMILQYTMFTVTHLSLVRPIELYELRDYWDDDDDNDNDYDINDETDDSCSDHVLETIRSMDHLVCLEWYPSLKHAKHRLYRMCNMDGPGLSKLKTLVMGVTVRTEGETFIESFSIPWVSTLEEIILPCRTGKWHAKVTPPSWANVPPPRGLIASSTVEQLRLCPELGTVIFSASSDPERDPSTWCDKRINGAIIRSYTNGADEMFHVRRLELLKCDPKLYDNYDPESMHLCDGGKDHQWMDQTYFEGMRVPMPVLDKIYKMIGEKRSWSTPGRNLELPDEAWAALKRGKKKAMRHHG